MSENFCVPLGRHRTAASLRGRFESAPHVKAGRGFTDAQPMVWIAGFSMGLAALVVLLVCLRFLSQGLRTGDFPELAMGLGGLLLAVGNGRVRLRPLVQASEWNTQPQSWLDGSGRLRRRVPGSSDHQLTRWCNR